MTCAGSFRSNNALHTLHLVMERFLPCRRRSVFGKEMIVVARLYACGRAAVAVAGMQALTRWDNRQVRRHHAGFTQLMLFHAVTPTFMAAAAKIFSRDTGDRAANAWVGQRKMRVGEIRLTSAHSKRSNIAAMAVEIIDHG